MRGIQGHPLSPGTLKELVLWDAFLNLGTGKHPLAGVEGSSCPHPGSSSEQILQPALITLISPEYLLPLLCCVLCQHRLRWASSCSFSYCWGLLILCSSKVRESPRRLKWGKDRDWSRRGMMYWIAGLGVCGSRGKSRSGFWHKLI